MLACLGRIAALLVLVGTLLASGGAAAKNGITVINQPNYNQLEIFWIGPDGAVRVMWKGVDGYWLGPVSLTPIGWGVPGSEITALWSVQNDQLEVFWVGRDGEVNMLWKDHNKDWNYPARLTGPGFALPGAPLTGFWQPEYHHLELFGIAPDGALSHVYKTDNKPWNPAGRLFGPGFGVPGSKPAAVYQPTGGQSQVFAVGSDGAVNLTWKPYNETWKEPFPVTKPGTAPAGAWLDALYQPQFDQVEVLFTDRDGAAVSVWKRGTNIYDWITTRVGDPGYAPPGAPVAAATQPLNDHLELFAIGMDGALNDVWKSGNGGWARYFSPSGPGVAPPGNTVAATLFTPAERMEAFYQDAEGAIWATGKFRHEAWIKPVRLTKARGEHLIDQAFCHAYWRDWYAGKRGKHRHIERDCQAFAASACREWHMTPPPIYLKNADGLYLLLGHRRQRDMNYPDAFRELLDEYGANSFGGNINWYLGRVGNTDADKGGNGQISQGRFDLTNGSISFIANLWVNPWGKRTLFRYQGRVNQLFRTQSGALLGGMSGDFFAVDGSGGSSWFSPVDSFAPATVCMEPDVLIKPIPVADTTTAPIPTPPAAEPVIVPPASAPLPQANAPAIEVPPATAPINPVPVIPTPVTPAPVTPAPVTPAPVTQSVPVTELPRGQCPAPIARVTEQLNIRDGASGEAPILGRLPADLRIQCLACNRSWCLFASDNPRSTVSRRYLEFEIPAQPVKDRPANQGQASNEPQQEQPPQQAPTEPAPSPQPEPEQAAIANFAGDWFVRTSSGLVHQVRFVQAGTSVVGSYTDHMGQRGQMFGTVTASTLVLQWNNQLGFVGHGVFVMSSDGGSFAGSFQSQGGPQLPGREVYLRGGTWESFVPGSDGPDRNTNYGACPGCGSPVDDLVVK